MALLDFCLGLFLWLLNPKPLNPETPKPLNPNVLAATRIERFRVSSFTAGFPGLSNTCITQAALRLYRVLFYILASSLNPINLKC